MDALNERGKPLKGSKILILGIAYKKNIDDARESPAVKIMELLRDRGAEVSYSDPHIPVFPKMRDHRFDLKSQSISSRFLANQDACIIATDHDLIDWVEVEDSSQLIIDCKNKLLKHTEKIIRS